MLDFLSIHVPVELRSHWTRIYLTTKRILTINPTIVNYWIHIRRDDFYRRLCRLRTNIPNDNWTELLTSDDDISLNDIQQIYQFIRASIHLIIEDDGCASPYYAQTKQNKGDKGTTIITLSSRLLQSDSDPVRIICHLSIG
jgi:hypothetical protein